MLIKKNSVRPFGFLFNTSLKMYRRPSHFQDAISIIEKAIEDMADMQHQPPYSNFITGCHAMKRCKLLTFIEIGCENSTLCNMVINQICPIIERYIRDPEMLNDLIFNEMKNPDEYSKNTQKCAEFIDTLNKLTKKCLKRPEASDSLKQVAQILNDIFTTRECQESLKYIYVTNSIFRMMIDLTSGQLVETFQTCSEFGGSNVPFQFLML